MPYLGSTALETSTANQELVPNPPAEWKGVVYEFSKFNFYNGADCHVIINGGNQIFIPANQGFSHDNAKKPIKSFKIVESAISFNWIGYF